MSIVEQSYYIEGIGELPEVSINQFMDVGNYYSLLDGIDLVGVTADQNAINGIDDIAGLLDKVKSGLSKAKSAVTTAFNKGKEFISKTVSKAKEIGTKAFNTAKDWAKKGIEKLKSGAKATYEKAKSKASDVVKKIKEKLPKAQKEKIPKEEKIRAETEQAQTTETKIKSEATNKLELNFFVLNKAGLQKLSGAINNMIPTIGSKLPYGWKVLGATVSTNKNTVNLYFKSPSSKISGIGVIPAIVPIAVIVGGLVAIGLIITSWKWVDLQQDKVQQEGAMTKKDLIENISNNPNLTEAQKTSILENLTKEGLIESSDNPEAFSLFGLPSWASLALIGVGAYLILSPKSPVQIIQATGKRK